MTVRAAAGEGGLYAAAGAGQGQGRGQARQGQDGTAGDGDTYAGVPGLAQAVVAAGRAGQDPRALREAREGIEAVLDELLTAAQREGRTLTEEEGRAFDAAGAVSDELAERQERVAADARRRARFAQAADAAAGSTGPNARPATPYTARGGDARAAAGRPPIGGSGTRFRFGDGRVVAALRPGESLERYARASAGEAWADPAAEPDLGQAVRALLSGDRSGLDDVSRSALGEGFGSAGGYLVPPVLSARILDLAREASAVIRAGAEVVPLGPGGVHVVATVERDPVPAWRAEHQPIPESEPLFGAVLINARNLGVIIPASNEFLQDAPNAGDILQGLLASAFAAELDRACLAGNGLGPEPTGIVNNVHVARVLPAGDGTDTVHPDMLTRLVHGLRAANAAGPLAVIARHEHLLKLDTTRTAGGELLALPQVLAETPRIGTNNLPEAGAGATWNAPVIAGAFAEMKIFLRQQVAIDIGREVGPYFQQNQTAFRATLRADVVVLRPKNFIIRQGVRAQ